VGEGQSDEEVDVVFRQPDGRNVVRRSISVLTLGLLMIPLIVTARAQTPTFASKALVDNDRVRIQRLTVPAGFRETLQVVPNDQIAIQITPGNLEVCHTSATLC
jgi:hypothetical protein